MISLKSIRFIIFIVFLKIVLLLLNPFLDATGIATAAYIRYLFTILFIATFTIIVIYLLGILKFLREENDILIAFKVFIGFELINFVLNMALSMLVFSKLHHSYLYVGYYYGIIEIIRFVILVYLSIQLTRMQDPVLKSSFVFFGVASLAACIIVIIAPFYASYMINYMGAGPHTTNIMRHIYSYAGMANILPLIAVLIILNQMKDRLNYVEETIKKGPFFTGYEDNSEKK
ncbi:hypothetical protein [Mucilaginibacter lappiensis]|uniref:Uncharacterized protein n=1 Tax=Mucilaginibacter lappiensis TaxID=354630 RepID=A0A1N7FWC1_9SPHI|nr:hypothetical protein [Mucilaginibacter lappiensis]MBB6112655.1 hypothetical protein [Mucilaginibacter lappiensis]MBB6126615.1 hypothetical protein [Mucilaginibacter lappiensis]SIS04525.1 hypothetical protein SAMN05421821_12032 [Mucilaginibacter lappiensis]